MIRLENQVRRAVRGGQTVNYSVTPIYRGADPVPLGVTMQATGSGSDQLDFYQTVLNRKR